jgi:hypothetical protein
VNSREAKNILAAHRPGRDSGHDAEIAEALEQVRRDPTLQQWWRQQQAFHSAMEQGFEQIPVPAGLRAQITARTKIIPLSLWQRPTTWAAAAALVLLLGLSALLWKPGTPEGSFQTFRSRMVRTVQRQYRMDMESADFARIRNFLDTNNAPADFVLPPNLAQLPPMGAGVLSFQGSRVSMVCLNSGAQGTLFLFIADGSGVKQPPTAAREFSRISKLETVSWTAGGKVYVLAGPGPREALQRYF